MKCLELDICSSFSKVGLNLGRMVYLRTVSLDFIVHFSPPSHSLLPPSLKNNNNNTAIYFTRQTPYVTPFTLVRQSLALFLPQESNWQQISEWFVCFCIAHSFEKGFPRKFASCLVLSD